MKLEGDLQEIELVPHLLELADERFTGAIRFENDGIIKILYFKEGDVLSASTNDRADSVDEILLRAGKVNRDHVRQALGKRKDSETLGDALLSMGFISRKELTWGRRTQVVGILRSIADWTAGSFQIVHDYLPNREEGTLFYLPQIILELAVTDPDKAGVEQKIDGGAPVFHKRPDFKERYSRLALNEDADAIVEQVDGERTAAEIAAVSKLDVFAVYKLLLALETLGMADRLKHEVTHEVSPSAAASLSGGALFAPPALLGEAEVPFGDEGPPPIPEPTGGAGIEERGLEEPAAGLGWSAPDLAAQPTDDENYRSAGAIPRSEEPVPPARSMGRLLRALVLLGVLGAAAWGGWIWWSGRGAEVAETPRAATAERAEEPTGTPPPAGSPEPVTISPEADPSLAPSTAAPTPNAAPAPSDAPRTRYQEMAEAFSREGRGVAYTLQFEIVCQTESVRRALAAGPQVWFVPIEYRGAPCFRVFWGRYETREEAESSRDEIPAELRGSAPVVVRPRELLR
jgi:hypothetical protein